jgi:hypothetical protein
MPRLGFLLIDSKVLGNGSKTNAPESGVWNHFDNPGARVIRSYIHGSPDNWEGRVDLVKDSFMIVDATYPDAHSENIYLCGTTSPIFGGGICDGGNTVSVSHSLLAGGGYMLQPNSKGVSARCESSTTNSATGRAAGITASPPTARLTKRRPRLRQPLDRLPVPFNSQGHNRDFGNLVALLDVDSTTRPTARLSRPLPTWQSRQRSASERPPSGLTGEDRRVIGAAPVEARGEPVGEDPLHTGAEVVGGGGIADPQRDHVADPGRQRGAEEVRDDSQ